MTKRHKSVPLARISGNFISWTSRYDCSFFDLACRYCATPYVDTKICHYQQGTDLQRHFSISEQQARRENDQPTKSLSYNIESTLENVVLAHAYTPRAAAVPLQVRQHTAQILLHAGFSVDQALKAKILQLAAEKSIAETAEQARKQWAKEEQAQIYERNPWTKKDEEEKEYLMDMMRLLNVVDEQVPEAITSSGGSTPKKTPPTPTLGTPLLSAMPPAGRQGRATRLIAWMRHR